MMKNIKYKVILLFAVLSMSSCEKWLEIKPTDGLIREDFWKTKEQLQAAVIGCYTSLLNAPLVQNLFIWGELRADMVSTTTFSTIEQVDITNSNILSTNSLTNWSSLYTTINYCNTVIQYGPGVKASDATLTQAQLDAYLSEAYALRGLMYFYLLRIWGEVPLQLKASSSDSQIEQLPKSSKEEVFAQIVKDLDFAAANAVLTYGTNPGLVSVMDKGRITKYTVYAIQADAYLWMEKYAEAIAACDKVIQSNKFGLVDGSNQASWFNTVFFNGNSTESIFEFQFDNQKLNPFFLMFADGARKQFVATPRVLDEFYNIDPVDPNNKDIRGDGSSVRGSDFTIWKFVGTSNSNTTRTVNSSFAHWYVYRYADILLLKAEALAWSGKGQEALDLVKVIRSRARAVSTTEESPDPTSAAAVNDYIMKERAREFAFEGKRWFDILRTAKRANYARLSYLIDIISDIAPNDKQQSMINKYKDVRSHYLPIIQSELIADKLLVQNPFYQ